MESYLALPWNNNSKFYSTYTLYMSLRLALTLQAVGMGDIFLFDYSMPCKFYLKLGMMFQVIRSEVNSLK